MGLARCLLVAALLCAACDDPGNEEWGGDGGPGPESSADLYEAERVWHFDMRLSDANYARLSESPRVYVQGDVRIGDSVMEQVGIRLKGAFSFQNLGGKASFKIKFNEFVPGQRFLGLEKITLNNMRQDRSEVHEWLAYQIFRGAGVPAPRSGFAQVSLNGEIYGLYANVETVDDRFLKDRFEEGEGNLYEAPWGADLDAESIDLYEQDEGEDRSRADLSELAMQVAAPGDSVFFGAEAAIDTDEFLRFVASEALSGHWDGYWKSNNYFLYHESPVTGEDSGLWSFMPWGLDQSFGQELDPFTSRGVLAEKCFTLPSCMSEYARIGLEVVDEVEALELQTSMEDAAALISDFVQEDPRSPHPPAKVARYQAIAQARLRALPEIMREHFSCMQGGVEQDRDGDGFGGCFLDCDDNSEMALPGGTELCDGIDNNCNGQVDEAQCPCREETIHGRRYLFCDVLVTHNQALRECEDRGGALAVFLDRATTEEAFGIASEMQASLSWYLGATDSAEEGAWLTGEGAVVSEPFFAPGEPDDFGGEHCAALASFAGGDWEDLRCSTVLPYICELPL